MHSHRDDPDAVIDYGRLRSIHKVTAYSSEHPYHMIQLTSILHPTAAPMRVLDATAHVGGFSLVWAAQYPDDMVHSVEIDRATYRVLRWNAHALELKNIRVHHGCIVDYLRGCKCHWDLIYADPPWGGNDYNREHTTLELGDRPVQEFIDNALTRATRVALKVPKSFDLTTLQGRYETHKIYRTKAHEKVDYLLLVFAS